MITPFRRIIRAGFVNFRRNGVISWAAVLMMTVTLSVIASLIFLQASLHSALDQIKDKVDVTIYINPGTDESKIMDLKDSLSKLPEVASVSYTNEADNLAAFRLRHQNDYSTIAALDEVGGNPLGAYLGVKAKDVSQYETIANFLNGYGASTLGSSSIIHTINYAQNKSVIDKLDGIISGAQKLGFLITLILGIISVIITFTLIRLTIFISKEEIGVMRLVGASKMGVRGPFMIEGAIYGIVATLITLIISWPITSWLGTHMTSFLGINMHDYFFSHFFEIFAIVLGSGILLGIISSILAIRKYLNI